MKRTPISQAILAGLASKAERKHPFIAPVMSLRAINQLGTQYELMIYGDIGESWYGSSVLAADVVAQLNALPPTVGQINVRINSYGGSVSDGLAIYNALKRMAATKAVTVDGVAMSIASLIAMAGDTIEMPEASLLMIHAPWGSVMGNSADMRDYADFLDIYAEAMAGAYMAKSGQSHDVIVGLLTDGKDHTYTGAQALELGFCDSLLNTAADDNADGTSTDGTEDEPDVTAFLAGMQRFTAHAPAMASAVRAALRHSTITATASGVSAGAQPARVATLGDSVMPAVNATPAEPVAAAAPATVNAASAPSAAEITARAHADMRERNQRIEAALKPILTIGGVSSLYTEALSDPSMSFETVSARALVLAGAHATPNASDPGRIEVGLDQRDKTRTQASNYLLVRAGSTAGMKPEEIAAARQGNPFNGMTMLEMARACIVSGGSNPSGWSKDRIVAAAITQSTSDFPNIFENILHKLLLNSYLSIEQTWRSFCRTSTLADFRAHNRYYMGGFSDLLPVDQTGEYQDGTFSDAEKEVITGQSKGRILNLSREMIINDDMGVFVTAAQKLGQAAGRTLEKDVYALFALNSGAGPVMSDGYNLFDATHHLNVAATGAVVGTQSFDDMRTGMGSQLDPSGNDFLNVAPATWVGPLKYMGDANVVNGSRYDTSVSSKFEIPNKSFGLLSKVVGTPRLTGTAWYGFANADVEPVLEVGFLDGVQEPLVASEESFRSNGLAWRATFDYGVAAVGFRGAWKNAGA